MKRQICSTLSLHLNYMFVFLELSNILLLPLITYPLLLPFNCLSLIKFVFTKFFISTLSPLLSQTYYARNVYKNPHVLNNILSSLALILTTLLSPIVSLYNLPSHTPLLPLFHKIQFLGHSLPKCLKKGLQLILLSLSPFWSLQHLPNAYFALRTFISNNYSLLTSFFSFL